MATPVKSLPDEPDIELKSFDSFTRLDGVLSARHMLGGGFVAFPRTVKHSTMNTFRPPEVTPRFEQNGGSAGDRRSLRVRIRCGTRIDGVGALV